MDFGRSDIQSVQFNSDFEFTAAVGDGLLLGNCPSGTSGCAQVGPPGVSAYQIETDPFSC
jgi:hypothetical protein